MDDRKKILTEFEEAVAGVKNMQIQQLVEAALRIKFPNIEIHDVYEVNGIISFKVRDGQYPAYQVEEFMNELTQNSQSLKN